MEKAKTPEEQFALLTEGFDLLLKGVMLMPISDAFKMRIFDFIADTMTNLVRLIKQMIEDNAKNVIDISHKLI